jgi:hypothetical protein
MVQAEAVAEKTVFVMSRKAIGLPWCDLLILFE